jgi:hypothetical protein
MIMRPIGIIGVLLIIAGAVILAMGGLSYVRDREEVQVGPIEVAAEERGFISPLVGGVILVAGVALLLAGRKRA